MSERYEDQGHTIFYGNALDILQGEIILREKIMIVDIRKAVSVARDYLKSVKDLVTESEEQIRDLRLEETELTDNEQYWLITLSYDVPIPEYRTQLRALINTLNRVEKKYEKEYRIFKIDTQTGEVKSMKIREQ